MAIAMTIDTREKAIVPNETIWTYGPSGIGKSALAHVFGTKLGLNVVYSNYPRTRRIGTTSVVLFEDLDSGKEKRRNVQSLMRYLTLDMLDRTTLVWCMSYEHPERVLGKTRWKVLSQWVRVIALEQTPYGRAMRASCLDKDPILMRVVSVITGINARPELWRRAGDTLVKAVMTSQSVATKGKDSGGERDQDQDRERERERERKQDSHFDLTPSQTFSQQSPLILDRFSQKSSSPSSLLAPQEWKACLGKKSVQDMNSGIDPREDFDPNRESNQENESQESLHEIESVFFLQETKN